MEALVLLLMGLLTGWGLAVDADPQAGPGVHHRPAAAGEPCRRAPGALSIRNLTEATAPVWVVEPDGVLCEVDSGRRVVGPGLDYGSTD